jgi:hypothetical protein
MPATTHDVSPIIRRRPAAVAAIVLFAVSTLFPIGASLIPAGTLPRWIGWLDGVSAFVLVLVWAALDVRMRRHVTAEDEVAAARVQRQASLILLILLVMFFLAGDRIDWHVLLPGLAWRGWLFVYALPSVIRALRAG